MALATDMAAAAGILPPALLVAFQFKLATGKPQNLESAGKKWEQAAQEVKAASEGLRARVAALPAESWKMNDRAPYERTVEEFCRELDALHDYCMAVSIALTALAWALLTYAVFAIGMATYLDVLAIAAVTVVAYPECLAAAQTGLSITWIASAILATLGGVAGLVMGGGTMVTANIQRDQGSTGTDAVLKKTFVHGSKGATANLVQSAANGALAYVNRSNGELFRPPGGGATTGSRGLPLREVDLDADRGFDRTWNVGGGVKLGFGGPGGPELELGNHHKIQDGDYKGGDAEVKGKVPRGPVDVGGGIKSEWDDKGVGGALSGSVANPGSGSKTEYEGALSPGKHDYTDKLTATSPAGTKEWNPAGKKPDETPPWESHK